MRATVSPAFPAVNGLITLIGLSGHLSVLAATVAIERATAAKDADSVRTDIMFCSRKSVMPRSRGAAALARRAVQIREMNHVRFGSKADISVCPRHVRFTPESGHRNRPAYYLRRTSSGSLAIFAAIRRASSFVSSLVAGSRLPRAYLLLFGFSVLPSFFAWVSSFGSFANGSNRTL